MRFRLLGAALLVAGFVQSSFGGIITNGHFDIGGTVYVTDFRTAAVITPGGTCPASATGMACIFWSSTGTLAGNGFTDISGAGLPNGDITTALVTPSGNNAANIFSLQNPPDVVGGPGIPSAPLFMSFNNGGITTLLDLTFIDLGTDSPAACGNTVALSTSGEQCTIPGSLFNFQNTPPPSPAGTLCNGACGSTATWVFEGVTSGPGQGNQNWVGNFTSQFQQGKPFEQVFADLSANGFVSNTFSATITLAPAPSVPEPGSLVMIGTGLIGLAAILRRRRTAKQS